MTNAVKKRAPLLALTFVFFVQTWALAASEVARFDRGPDPEDPMQAELVEIIQDLPFMPGISEKLQVLVPSKGGQKFRPDFGAMPIRGFLKPNSISVLVIGQDATHIAEGANRPGIAGFGGRVQDMLLHFGIYEGVAFTNLYVNTISGQYGSRNTPVVKNDNSVVYQNVIENRQWLMTHEGPYGEWRNRFLSWVIRNNLQSLKMVMMLGQAGKDAGANLVNYLGGQVAASTRIGNGAQFNVPVFKMVRAGGNNEWAVPLTKDGKDVAEVLRQNPALHQAFAQNLNAKIADKQLELDKSRATGETRKAKQLESAIRILNMRLEAFEKPFNYGDADRKTQEPISAANAQEFLSANPKEAIALMVFSNGGPQKNGVLYPQQFGGWDLKTMTVKGKSTRSIQGLQIPCGQSFVGACTPYNRSVTAPDIVFVGSPHPTVLSMGTPEDAARSVESELIAPLRIEMQRGWQPPQPEKGFTSRFLANARYEYGRGVIPRSHGDPGITDLRLLPVSTAIRDGGSTIVIGSRNVPPYSEDLRKAMEQDTPSNQNLLNSHNVLTGRPKFQHWIFRYDPGPSDQYAELLFDSLNARKQSYLWPKAQYSPEAHQIMNKKLQDAKTAEDRDDAYAETVDEIFNKYGIDAFNFKSHPNAGFFGHYRGTFVEPRVVILADPHGYDSFITSKAATGERGQYVNGLMQDLGVDSQYLVLSTVPVMMDGATKEEWNAFLLLTQSYREKLLQQVYADHRPELLLADGPYAAQELRRMGYSDFIEIKRGATASAGIVEAGQKITRLVAFQAFKDDMTGARVDIPREHLTWIARTWEGTSGDRVITADDKANKGKAFIIVAPDWARQSETYFTQEQQNAITEMINRLVANGEPAPNEKVGDFAERRSNCVSLAEYKDSRAEKPTCALLQSVQYPGVLPATGSY